MALIVEYHVTADVYPVGGTSISAGMQVSLDTNGTIIPTPISGVNVATPLGIAGDSRLAAEGRTTAYSDTVVIGADGANTRFTGNRVSDFYNETLASDKITVYNGGGKFWISEDLFDSASTIGINDRLTLSTTTAGEWLAGATGGQELALAVGVSQAYSSGVPGTDVDGSITLGSFIPIVLRR